MKFTKTNMQFTAPIKEAEFWLVCSFTARLGCLHDTGKQEWKNETDRKLKAEVWLSDWW